MIKIQWILQLIRKNYNDGNLENENMDSDNVEEVVNNVEEIIPEEKLEDNQQENRNEDIVNEPLILLLKNLRLIIRNRDCRKTGTK